MLGAMIAVVLAILVALVIYGTIAKNKWGINLRPVSCPNCGTPVPRTRTPNSSRQALWGGYACPKCGCEMDKWGRPLTAT
jgi:hypothetical protein